MPQPIRGRGTRKPTVRQDRLSNRGCSLAHVDQRREQQVLGIPSLGRLLNIVDFRSWCAASATPAKGRAAFVRCRPRVRRTWSSSRLDACHSARISRRPPRSGFAGPPRSEATALRSVGPVRTTGPPDSRMRHRPASASELRPLAKDFEIDRCVDTLNLVTSRALLLNRVSAHRRPQLGVCFWRDHDLFRLPLPNAGGANLSQAEKARRSTTQPVARPGRRPPRPEHLVERIALPQRARSPPGWPFARVRRRHRRD